mgnify:CR=1 FL=1
MATALDLGCILGPQGNAGTPGADGRDGVDGSTLLHGYETPDDSIGADGDYYLDASAGQLFYKSGGAWGSPVAFFATEGAVIDNELSPDSTNAVQNRIVTAALAGKVSAGDVSHTPVNGGSAPFSVGGAYTLRARIAAMDTVATATIDMASFAHEGTYSSTHEARRYGKTVFLCIESQGGTAWQRRHNQENPIVALVPVGFRPFRRQYFFGRIAISGVTHHCGIWVNPNGTVQLADTAYDGQMHPTFTNGKTITSVQLTTCYEVNT